MLERVIAAHISEYLETHDLLSPHQFGFRKGHSTEDQLLLTYSDIVSKVDMGCIVDVIHLDISKAFDVVSHTALLGKWRSLGFCNAVLGWMEQFLSGRNMRVSVRGVDSQYTEVLSGVPQLVFAPPVNIILVFMCDSRCFLNIAVS